MTRFEHAGAAVPTTLSGGVTASATTINLAAATGWPTGAVGPFWVTIDAGTASEEKVLVESRSGTALTVLSRGADGTAATSHADGAVIFHSFSAVEADAANRVVEEVDAVAGSLVGTTGTQTLTNKTLTSPAINTPTGDVARGTLRYEEVAVSQGSIGGTDVDLTGLSAEVTVGTSRRVRVKAYLASVNSTGGPAGTETVLASLKEGSTVLESFSLTLGGAGIGGTLTPEIVLTPSPGAHTYKVSLRREAGGGTITLSASSTAKAWLHVEDIGAA